MEAEQINNAVKIMSQNTNMKQDLKIYTKVEQKPKFITKELDTYYQQTDLSLKYVYDCCLSLKPLKGIDVNDMQVQFWYIEFIKMGWQKKDFDKQFEAVKRATLYNRIDLENWLKTEIMYNQIDFNVELEKRINSKIQRGRFLKDEIIELTDSEKQEIELVLAKEIELDYYSRLYEARENYKQEVLEKLKSITTERKTN